LHALDLNLFYMNLRTNEGSKHGLSYYVSDVMHNCFKVVVKIAEKYCTDAVAS